MAKQTITITFSPKSKNGMTVISTGLQLRLRGRYAQRTATLHQHRWMGSGRSVKQGTSQAVITMAKPYYPANTFVDIYHPKATSVDTFTKGWIDNPHNEGGVQGPYIVDSGF